jgi:hypothetical protein
MTKENEQVLEYRGSEPCRWSGWAVLCFGMGLIGMPILLFVLSVIHDWLPAAFWWPLIEHHPIILLFTPSIISVIAGAIALREVTRMVSPRRGIGFIIAGIILAGLWVSVIDLMTARF